MEHSELPGLTIPDRSLTIPEIIARYTSGRSLNVKVYDEYTGDHDHLTGVDIRTMDITEIKELVDVTNTNLRSLKSEQDRRRATDQAAALEKSIIEKYEARRRDQLESQKEPPAPKFLQPSLPLKNSEK